MVFPDAAAGSPVPLYRHSINPFKVHSPAAVTPAGQGRKVARRDREKKGGKKKQKQEVTKEKNAAGQRCSHLHAERAKQTSVV